MPNSKQHCWFLRRPQSPSWGAVGQSRAPFCLCAGLHLSLVTILLLLPGPSLNLSLSLFLIPVLCLCLSGSLNFCASASLCLCFSDFISVPIYSIFLSPDSQLHLSLLSLHPISLWPSDIPAQGGPPLGRRSQQEPNTRTWVGEGQMRCQPLIVT